MKKVFYVNYYDVPENAGQKRNYVVSAATKSKYEFEAFERAGYQVEIVSASATMLTSFCEGKDIRLSENICLHLFDSLPTGNVIKRIKSRMHIKKEIYNYLYSNITDDDTLVVYHSLAYTNIIGKIKKKKNPKLVIEANEIYSDVTGVEKTRKKEMRFLESADAYILSTELLNKQINTGNKPYAINYGTYESVKDFPRDLFKDNKIHCVYAGTLEKRKGCITAVRAAEFLDDNYRIHILGFGNEKDTQNLSDEIKAVNAKGKAIVTYDGTKRGEEYLCFLQNCQVGFSTQSPDADFNETSFPSKVLSYLSNGLRVVSVRIKAIENSDVADLLYFYDDDNPEAVAAAVRSIDFNDDYNGKKTISELDGAFVSKVTVMLENKIAK